MTRSGRAAAAACLLLAGCGGGAPQTPGPAAPALRPGPSATALPDRPCPVPTPLSGEVVEGLVLPEGAVLTEVVRQGPVVQVRGYVGRPPLVLRAEYEARTDVEVLTVEDEVVEVETLVSDGRFRTYLRGTGVCPSGTALDGLVSRERG